MARVHEAERVAVVAGLSLLAITVLFFTPASAQTVREFMAMPDARKQQYTKQYLTLYPQKPDEHCIEKWTASQWTKEFVTAFAKGKHEMALPQNIGKSIRPGDSAQEHALIVIEGRCLFSSWM